ncbi:tripartite tricarboxylate transporter substrate binding protein [Alcaligenaceae bacterium]|nr:tripartite tricarboxylate transporter substrate binding protein [Alcaligenaceae bacterium]
MNKFTRCLSMTFLGTVLAIPTIASADQWPSRAVTIVVPYPPGSSNDMLGRLLAESYSKKFNQTFLVENRPGASGSVGITEVAKAKADGYTVLVVSNSMVTNLSLPDQVRYDVFRDFEPVSLAGTLPVVMVTNPKVPGKTVQELIKAAKEKPGDYKYGSSGIGSPHQLTSELFQSLTATDFLHVPYKGQSPIITELIAGRLDIGFVTLGPVLQYLQDGTLNAMGMLGDERSSLAPNIPTLGEAGVHGLDFGWWLGVFLPKGTDPSIVDALAKETAYLTKDNKPFQEKLQNVRIAPVGSTPAEFKASLQYEIDTWKKVAKEAGIGK